MRYLIFLVSVLMIGFYSCGGQSGKNAQRETIKSRQDSLQTRSKKEAMKEDAEKLVQHINDYVDKYPNDTMTPKYLYTVANYHFNYLNNNQEAFDNLEQLRDEYPDHPMAPFALFKQGFMHQKNDKQSAARSKYKKFLENYPEHKIAEDVKISLKTLGMSTEEQLEKVRKIREESAGNQPDSLSN